MRTIRKYFPFFTSIIIIFSILLLASTQKVNSQDLMLYFSADSDTVTSGEEFSIDIDIDTKGNNINGVTADFSYPSDILEVMEIDTSNSVIDSSVEEDFSEKGVVYISRFVGRGETYSGSGNIATVKFKAVADGEIVIKFTENAVVTDSNATDILETTEELVINKDTSITGKFKDNKLLLAIPIAVILIFVILLFLALRKSKKLFTLLILVFILLVGGTAGYLLVTQEDFDIRDKAVTGDTWTVCVTGDSDPECQFFDGDGIQAAIDAADTTDIVKIKSGEYTDLRLLIGYGGKPSKNIIIEGEKGTILYHRTAEAAIIIGGTSNVTVRRLTIHGAVYPYGENANIIGNVMILDGSYGVLIGGGTATVRNNIIHWDGTPAALNNQQGLVVIQNTSERPEISNNVLRGGRQAIFGSPSSVADIYNNIFYEVPDAISNITISPQTCTYNLFYESPPEGSCSNNQTGNPLFVNADGGDYHLQSGSPAIDGGDPDYIDADGSCSDIGAYGGSDACTLDPQLSGCEPPSGDCTTVSDCSAGEVCDTETNTCIEGMKVFVSSAKGSGNVMGLAGGDGICNDLAQSANLTGDFKAWLSTSSMNAKNRFQTTDKPYYMVNGQKIADNLSDLLQNKPDVPISFNEQGNDLRTQDYTHVLTGTDDNGVKTDYTCQDWESEEATDSGLYGTLAQTNTWTALNTKACNILNQRIYCFEDTSSTGECTDDEDCVTPCSGYKQAPYACDPNSNTCIAATTQVCSIDCGAMCEDNNNCDMDLYCNTDTCECEAMPTTCTVDDDCDIGCYGKKKVPYSCDTGNNTCVYATTKECSKECGAFCESEADCNAGETCSQDTCSCEGKASDCSIADVWGRDGGPDGVVNMFDLSYVLGRWKQGGTNADISGPSGIPDGSVNIWDVIKITQVCWKKEV